MTNATSYNKKLQDLVRSRIDSDIAPKDAKDYFLLFMLSKGYKTHQSIILLCEAGYGEDAFILSRALFELVISTLYIMKDETDERVLRYFNYDWVVRKKMYDSMKGNDQFTKRISSQESTEGNLSIEKIESMYEEAIKKYKYGRFGWSDRSIKGMAEDVGRLDAYNTLYVLQCNICHTNPNSINEYLEDNDKEILININPSKNLVNESLRASLDFFGLLIEEVNKKYEWGIQESLEDLFEEYFNGD